MIFVENLSDSALISLVSIIVVFAVLLIIIGVTELIFKFTGLMEFKNNSKKDNKKNKENNTEIKDDDMLVAVLVASIDYRNETNGDVRLANVEEIR